MKQVKKTSQCEVPSFDESILSPKGDERVLVFRTRPNQEFALEKLCRASGIICYLPVCRAIALHNFTQKGRPYSYPREVLRPMFPTYIFIKISPQVLQNLRNSSIFARCVPLGYNQERLLEEIRTVRVIEVVGFEQELEIHTDIPQGGFFLITSGIWTGIKGHLINKDGVDKWTVELDFCHQAVTTFIDPKQFKMVPAEE